MKTVLARWGVTLLLTALCATAGFARISDRTVDPSGPNMKLLWIGGTATCVHSYTGTSCS